MIKTVYPRIPNHSAITFVKTTAEIIEDTNTNECRILSINQLIIQS